MAYIDKVCGCCGKYVHPTEDKFKISNVCKQCITDVAMQGTNIKSFKDSYDKSYTTQRERSFMGLHWISSSDSSLCVRKLISSRSFGHTEYGRKYPMFYDLDLGKPNMPVVTNRDIRQLRRTLRMLGISGKIEQYIK